MNDEPSRDLTVFAAVVKLPAEEQLAYLAGECGEDHALKARVEALLRAHSEAGNFMEQPPGDFPATTVSAIGEKAGDHIGRYKLLEQIGEGGCGIVFMAEQEEPVHRRVALKIIKPGMDTKSVIARFEAERQALALMDHPNIAKVFDAGATDSRRPYFVMELVRGVKITQYCDEHSLTTEGRLKLFTQVCQAVQHAHQRGIIHRDIKPSNILVTQSSEGIGMPVVIDFGIAKATSNQRLTDKTLFTALEMLIGTPAYMSPEQAGLASVDVDTRSDIYSLGVLLYELLTSSTPFDTEELLKAGLEEIRRVVREEEPLRPSMRLSKLPRADLTTVAQRRQSDPPRLIHAVRGDLDWIVMKALEKDRTRRYETAYGLALDVKRFLDNEAVSARPPSKLYRFQKLVQRNKLLFSGIFMVALVLVGALIVISSSLAEERRLRHVAETASIKSQEVTKFLEDILKGVGPAAASGQDTKMLRGILDRASETVGNEVTDQPAVEADLRNLIGTLYREIGNYRRAEEMHSKALAIRRNFFGSENPAVAESLNDMAIDLQAQTKLSEAEKAFAEALAIRRRRFGTENKYTATSLNDLGALYRDESRFSEGEALAREALGIRQKLWGEENLDVAGSLRNLAITLGCESKWAESEANARKVLAIRRKLLGPVHPEIPNALSDLAWILDAQGKFDEEEALRKECLTTRRKLLPEEHPDVAASMAGVGDCMLKRGHPKEADPILREALSRQREVLAQDDPALAYTLDLLGVALREEGKWSEAEAAHREALALTRGRVGNENVRTVRAMRNLGETLDSEGKWSEAETVLRESLVMARKRVGIENPEAFAALECLVRVLLHQNRLNEAEHLLNEAPTPEMVQDPAKAERLALQTQIFARKMNWEEAAAACALAIRYQPMVQHRYDELAGILAMKHSQPAYEQLCQKILAMFADGADPYIAERIASDCLLLPDSGMDLHLVDELASKAVQLRTDQRAIGYFQSTKALSEYRLGHLTEAEEWANKSLNTTEVFARAKACAVLAMTQWKLGKKEPAQTALSQGNKLVPSTSAGQEIDLGDAWVAWLFARVSLDEAAEVVIPVPTKDDNSANKQ